MATVPLMVSVVWPPSWRMRPSNTLTRLNRGTFSTRGSEMVFMLYVAMSPADSIPYSVPSALVTGMPLIFCSLMMCQARSMVTVASRVGGVS